jgi:hypothetical protein
MSKMRWGELKDAPVKELFKGIRVRPLLEDESGIRAMVVEFDPGSCWEGGDDVHESKSDHTRLAQKHTP